MEYLGNKEILKNYKIGFLCSRKVPASVILKTYDWAIEQRDTGSCIISGFHSKIEKDIFELLLKGDQPIIMVLARGIKKRWEKEISDNIEKGRLLVMSPFDSNEKRITRETSVKRNQVVVGLADEIYIAYSNSEGNIENILKNPIML